MLEITTSHKAFVCVFVKVALVRHHKTDVTPAVYVVFGIERCSILCDFDARQSRASKSRDKFAGLISHLHTSHGGEPLAGSHSQPRTPVAVA